MLHLRTNLAGTLTRLSNAKLTLLETIYKTLPKQDGATIRISYLDEKYDIVCSYSEARYKKDKHEMQKQVVNLLKAVPANQNSFREIDRKKPRVVLLSQSRFLLNLIYLILSAFLTIIVHAHLYLHSRHNKSVYLFSQQISLRLNLPWNSLPNELFQAEALNSPDISGRRPLMFFKGKSICFK